MISNVPPEFTAFLRDAVEVMRKVKSDKRLTLADQRLIERVVELQSKSPERGRPRAGPLPPLPVYDSIAQASAHTELPMSLFKEEKRKGNPAFRSNRVYLGEFIKVRLSRPSNGHEIPDLHYEQILETRERRKLLEKENAERDGDLMPRAEVAKMINESLMPVRQALFALPAECAALCNPADPGQARGALQNWVDNRLPLIREMLPKPDQP